MKQAICALLLVAGLPACQSSDRVRETIKQEGAGFYDRVLDDAAFVICRGSSIGAVRRKYGGTAEAAEAYNAFCRISVGEVDVLPVEPEAE